MKKILLLLSFAAAFIGACRPSSPKTEWNLFNPNEKAAPERIADWEAPDAVPPAEYDYREFEAALREEVPETETGAADPANYQPLQLRPDLQGLSADQFRMQPAPPVRQAASRAAGNASTAAAKASTAAAGDSAKAAAGDSAKAAAGDSAKAAAKDSAKAAAGAEPLSVVDYGPQGVLETERLDNADLYLSFSSPMVPLAQLGEPITALPFLSVSPAMEGRFRWLGSKTLNFEPTAPLKPDTSYRVSVQSGLTALNGQSLREPFAFSFRTEPVQLISVEPLFPRRTRLRYHEDLPPIAPLSFRLSFSYPIGLEEVKQGITFPDAVPRSIQWVSALDAAEKPEALTETERQRLRRQFILTVNDSLPEASRWSVQFNDSRPYRFWTFKPFTVDTASIRYVGDNELRIGFSHPVSMEQAAQCICFPQGPQPEPEDFLPAWEGVRIRNFKVPFRSTLSVLFKKELSDLYGRTLGRDVRAEVPIGDADPVVRFYNDGYHFLEAAFPPQLVWQHRNILSVAKGTVAVPDPVEFILPALKKVSFRAVENETQTEAESFREYLNEKGHGAVYVGIEAAYREQNDPGIAVASRRTDSLIQVTDLGVSVRYAANGALVWVQSLSGGNPVADAKVEALWADKKGKSLLQQARTDSVGFAHLIFDPQQLKNRLNGSNWMGKQWEGGKADRMGMEGMIIRVQTPDDQAVFVPQGGHNIWATGVLHHEYGSEPGEKLQHLCFTDRNLYRPGEKLYFRGMVLSRSVGDYRPYRGPYTLSIVNTDDSQAAPLTEVKGTTTAGGGYFTAYELPKNLPVGNYAVVVRLPDRPYPEYSHFRVSEFKRARFELQWTDGEDSVLAGETLQLEGAASLLSGGKLPKAPYSVFWLAKGASFSPKQPQYSYYRFGVDDFQPSHSFGKKNGTLNSDGKAFFVQKTASPEIPGKTQSYTCRWSVRDAGEQQITASKTVTVHPAAFYLGGAIASAPPSGWWSPYLPKDRPIPFEVAAVTPEELPYEALPSCGVEIFRHEWQEIKQEGLFGSVDYRWEEKTVSVDKGRVRLPKKGRGSYRWTPKKAGSYEIRLSAEDKAGRTAVTAFRFYVTGGDWGYWMGNQPTGIELTPEKELYTAGETARIFMKSPLEKGTYWLTLEREGILEERRLELKSQTHWLEVPIKDSYYPVIYVAIGTATPRTALPPADFHQPDFGKPQSYFGAAELRVDSDLKKLNIEVQFTRKHYRPGERAMAKIRVTHQGTPVANAECLFALVDRGVLDWTDYHLPNPVDYFYAPDKFPHCVEGGDSRNRLMQPVLYRKTDLAGGDGKDDPEPEPANKAYAFSADRGRGARTDFNPVAHLEPFLMTDADGCALVDFLFPDNLTTYRTTVLASARDWMGYYEDDLTVTQEVTLQLARPMTLRMGDEAECSLLVHNRTDRRQTVTLKVSSDALLLSDEGQRSLVLEPEALKRVPITVTPLATGEAALEIACFSKGGNDCLREKIEVLRPSVREAFTVVGNSTESGRHPETVVLPDRVIPTEGGLELNFMHSPFPFLPQTIAETERQRLFPPSLEDLLYQAAPHFLFNTDLKKISPRLSYNPKKIRELIAFLKQTMQSDGGFAYYPDPRSASRSTGSRSSLDLSLRVAEANYWAEMRGNPLLGKKQKAALHAFLTAAEATGPLSVGQKSYFYYVRSLMGENVQSSLESFIREIRNPTLSERLLHALTYWQCGNSEAAQNIYREMKNRLKIGTQTVELKASVDSPWWGNEPLLNLSLLLLLHYRFHGLDNEAFRLANSLTAVQKNHLWYSRRGLFSYWVTAAAIAEEDTSWFREMTASVRLGDRRILQTLFEKGRQENDSFFFPMNQEPLSAFPKNRPLPLSFEAQGKGDRGYYYAAILSYALPSEGIGARDEGIVLQSSVETPEGKPLPQPELTVGETYRMKVELSLKKEAYQFVLEVPLPSGCDAIIDGGDGEGEIRLDSDASVRGWGKNSLFYRFSRLNAGSYHFEFLFRAVHAGLYPTPPIQALLLDEPEVFGRTAGRLWRISR